VLDWDSKPVLHTDHPWPVGYERDRVPSEVVDAAWSRTSALDDSTRVWAATAWGWCAHPEAATNQLRILLGDSDRDVKMAGFYAIQDVDLDDPAWLPEALEALLHEPYVILFDRDGDDPVPEWVFTNEEFRRGFTRVLLRSLDDGATPLDLDFYMESLHRFDPR
jgi:hypothetical protein